VHANASTSAPSGAFARSNAAAISVRASTCAAVAYGDPSATSSSGTFPSSERLATSPPIASSSNIVALSPNRHAHWNGVSEAPSLPVSGSFTNRAFCRAASYAFAKDFFRSNPSRSF
jgi:hypothetical protein